MRPSDQKTPAPPRKKYSPPVIRRYGALRALTRNVGKTGLIDGGGKGAKTGP